LPALPKFVIAKIEQHPHANFGDLSTYHECDKNVPELAEDRRNRQSAFSILTIWECGQGIVRIGIPLPLCGIGILNAL
jgi:hypothetical protein